MTRPAADSIKVTWAGTGTGTMSLGSAVSGFQAFPAALNGHVVSYTIEHQSATEREMGIGTYTSSGTTLTRDLVTFSTAGGTTKVAFSAGTKHVRLAGLAHDIVENLDTVDPGVNDDITAGYIAGRSRWRNTTSGHLFFCYSHAAGAAIWRPIGELKPTAVQTADYLAVVGDIVRTNTAIGSPGNPFNVTLPASPSDGDRIAVLDTTESWPDFPVTLLRNGKTIGGVADDVLLDGANRIDLIFNAAADDWDFASVGVGVVGGGGGGGGGGDDVTLAGTPDYITISGQVITRNPINLGTHVTGDLPVADGGTGSSTAAGARTNLGLVIGTNVEAFAAAASQAEAQAGTEAALRTWSPLRVAQAIAALSGAGSDLINIVASNANVELVDPLIRTPTAGEIAVAAGSLVRSDLTTGTHTITVHQADVSDGWTCTVTKWAAGSAQVTIAAGTGLTLGTAISASIFSQFDAVQVSRIGAILWVS